MSWFNGTYNRSWKSDDARKAKINNSDRRKKCESQTTRCNKKLVVRRMSTETDRCQLKSAWNPAISSSNLTNPHKRRHKSPAPKNTNENNNWIELNVFFFLLPSLLIALIRYSCTHTNISADLVEKFLRFIDKFFSRPYRLSSAMAFTWTKGRCFSLARTAMCIVFWLSIYFFSSFIFLSYAVLCVGPGKREIC